LPADGRQVSASLADEALAEPEVTAAIPVRRMSGLFVDEEESVPLSVTGGEAAAIDSIYGLGGRIVEGDYSLDEAQILVGLGFADEAGVGPGDGLSLVLPDGGTAEYEVAGIFDLGAAAA